MKEMICIVCPRGCRLTVDENNGYAVTGNACPRGEDYGRNEASNPVRVLTTTVKIEGAAYRRCPVRTQSAIPRGKLFEAMQALNQVSLVSPVQTGDVILENICNTGINVIATKSM